MDGWMDGSVSHEFLSLPRLYAGTIHFSTHDLTNLSVFVGWCSSSFCFHPPCPKPLDWIGVQSNWFSLTFSRSIFQTIPAFECPISSTSMFLRHTVPYFKSESLLFFSLTQTSSFLSVILLVYWLLFFLWLFDVSLPHYIRSLLWSHLLNTKTEKSTVRLNLDSLPNITKRLLTTFNTLTLLFERYEWHVMARKYTTLSMVSKGFSQIRKMTVKTGVRFVLTDLFGVYVSAWLIFCLYQ